MIGLTGAKLALLATILVALGVRAAQAAPATDAAPPDCAAPHRSVAAAHPLVVTINPATAWQPRGGTILVEIRGDEETLARLVFHACLGWSGPQGAAPAMEAQVERRPSNRVDLVNIGVQLPDMDPVEGSWPDRLWHGEQNSTGFGIVPLANLRILGVGPSGLVLDNSQTVGVTSLWNATIFTVVCVAISIGILHELARRRGVLANLVVGPGRRFPGQILFLRLITASDGRASLSQLQILLWTFVVGASAVFVMCLSGNLIDVTNGTLALLGIAGASGVLAETQRSRNGNAQPSWTDLSVPEDGSPGTDVKRVQMLFFTVISAAFVLLKVVTSYVIPDIPTGYLLLMGISNGVYVGGKFAKASD